MKADQPTKKVLTGIVISTSMSKTIRVKIERQVTHPLYRKQMKRTQSFSVHCEDTSVQVGDRVSFVASKPISKTKHFVFIKKVTL